MKNITISLDAELADWLRVNAAKRGVSVSRFVGDLVYEHMNRGRDYEAARRRFLSRRPFHFGWVDGRPPTREEIHDRARAREALGREDQK